MGRKAANGKPVPHNDRGEWRPFYEVLWDDPEFQALTAEQRWVWVTLKGRCGPCGIRLIPALPHVLSRWTGIPFESLSNPLSTLQTAEKIELEGDMVWVRRGIDFEPTLFKANPNHRKFVANTLNALPRTDLVRRFALAHPEWLEGTGYSVPEPIRIRSASQPLPLTPTPTPTTPTAAAVRTGWDGAELTDEAREKLTNFARSHNRPADFRDMVKALGPGGTYERTTWAVLSLALVTYAGSEIPGPPGQKILIRFIDDAKQAGASDEGEFARLARTLREKTA